MGCPQTGTAAATAPGSTAGGWASQPLRLAGTGTTAGSSPATALGTPSFGLAGPRTAAPSHAAAAAAQHATPHHFPAHGVYSWY